MLPRLQSLLGGCVGIASSEVSLRPLQRHVVHLPKIVTTQRRTVDQARLDQFTKLHYSAFFRLQLRIVSFIIFTSDLNLFTIYLNQTKELVVQSHIDPVELHNKCNMS